MALIMNTIQINSNFLCLIDNLPGGGGGGGLLYNRDMDVRQGLSNPYLCRPEFGQSFAPFAAKWRKIFKNIYPKTAENEFLAKYLCVIEKEFVKSLLFDQENYYFTKFETLIT